MRVWFIFFTVVLWLGIWLTGFDKVHWLLYIPAVGLLFASATGVCLTQMAVFALFSKKDE